MAGAAGRESGLMLLALLGNGPYGGLLFRDSPADFLLDNFPQRDIGQTQRADVVNERLAETAAARVELAHTARNEIHENIRVPDLFQCFFAEFSVHYFSETEQDRVSGDVDGRNAKNSLQTWGGLRHFLGRNLCPQKTRLYLT